MKLIGVRQTLLAAGLLIGVSSGACSHDAANSRATAAHKLAKPGPEESFKLIDETFRRRVAETPVGFVVSDPSRRSTMVGTNKVSSELIRPTNPGDPFKAIITVESESRYSIKRMKGDANDKSEDQNSGARSNDQLAATGDKKDDEAFNLSEPAPDSKKSYASEDVIARRPDQEVRKYELLYQNGRWNLVTELNKETEQSIQNAFKNALETQI